MKYSTVQYITLHYITVQYNIVQYSTVQYSTVQSAGLSLQLQAFSKKTPVLKNEKKHTVCRLTPLFLKLISTVQYSTVQYSAVHCLH